MKNSIILLTFVFLSICCTKISAYTEDIYTNGDYTIEGTFTHPEIVNITFYLLTYNSNNNSVSVRILDRSQQYNNEYSFKLLFDDIMENDSEHQYFYCINAAGSLLEHYSFTKDTAFGTFVSCKI